MVEPLVWSEIEYDVTKMLYQLYAEQPRTVDDLPYSTSFDWIRLRILEKYPDVECITYRRLWKLLIHARKNKKNPLPKKTTRKTGRDDNPFKGKVKGFGFSK